VIVNRNDVPLVAAALVHEGGAALLRVSQRGPASPLLSAELCLPGATGLEVAT
jgi:hypothetical protein